MVSGPLDLTLPHLHLTLICFGIPPHPFPCQAMTLNSRGAGHPSCLSVSLSLTVGHLCVYFWGISLGVLSGSLSGSICVSLPLCLSLSGSPRTFLSLHFLRGLCESASLSVSIYRSLSVTPFPSLLGSGSVSLSF